MDYEHCSDNLSAVGLVDAHPFAHPCAKAMHTRVQKGVRPDGLPSEDLPEDPKAFIFQRFRGDADSSWQYGHLTDVSEHIVHIDLQFPFL